MARSRERLAVAGLVVATAVWGGTFVAVQEAVRTMPVLAFLGYRFLASAALLALLFAYDLRRLSARGLLQGTWMGLCLAGGFILQTYGLTLLPVPAVAFLTGLFVVFTPLLSLVLLRRALGRPVWWAIGASALGLYLLTGGPAHLSLGDVIVVACSVSFAGQILATEAGLAHHSFGGLVTVEMAVCGLLSLAGATAARQLVPPETAQDWQALAITAVLAGAFGFTIQAWAQRWVSAGRTAIIMAAEPVFAALFAYLLQGSTLTADGWAGAGLIMAAIVIVEVLPKIGARAHKRPLLDEGRETTLAAGAGEPAVAGPRHVEGRS